MVAGFPIFINTFSSCILQQHSQGEYFFSRILIGSSNKIVSNTLDEYFKYNLRVRDCIWSTRLSSGAQLLVIDCQVREFAHQLDLLKFKWQLTPLWVSSRVKSDYVLRDHTVRSKCKGKYTKTVKFRYLLRLPHSTTDLTDWLSSIWLIKILC